MGKVLSSGVAECFWEKMRDPMIILLEAPAHEAEMAALRQAESRLQCVVHKVIELRQDISTRPLKNIVVDGNAKRKSPLEQLTSRQREILQLIAEGQDTKQITKTLKVSPKTAEYHRMNLMAGLNLHDVPGLVRFAFRVGLISQKS